MKKFKISKEGSKRLIALAMTVAFVTGITTGCSNSKKDSKSTTNVVTTSNLNESNSVDFIKNEIIKLFPNLSEDVAKNFALILLLDSIAKEDEFGKISSDIMMNYKDSIDANNMMSDFNAVLDNMEFSMIENNSVISTSNILPKGYERDSLILQTIESITSNIINLANNSGSKGEINSEFSKIYKLFVLEEEIEENRIVFSVRDLSYANRAVASTYARVAAYFARSYITEEEKQAIDDRTNDQNSKAYIKTILEILDNEMPEKSETDVVDLFNKKYSDVSDMLTGKINLSDETVSDLTNYINLEYLNSEKVAYQDKTQILNSYDNEDVSNTILAIDAINAYNISNNQKLIRFSDLLVENYKGTDQGKIDTIALDFVQYNAIMLLNTIGNEENGFNNPYFNNLYKYFTKQNFSHTYGNGEQVEINWQNISDGTNFVCYEIIRDTLSKLNIKYIEDYNKIINENLGQSIQFIQNSILGECEKVDVNEYIKK